jgi:hypothetical protein
LLKTDLHTSILFFLFFSITTIITIITIITITTITITAIKPFASSKHPFVLFPLCQFSLLGPPCLRRVSTLRPRPAESSLLLSRRCCKTLSLLL